MTTPVTLHDDEILAHAADSLGKADRPREYGGHYLDCPGCARLVHHSDAHDHPKRCRALRDLAAWECNLPLEEDRDPQPARLPETTGGAS